MASIGEFLVTAAAIAQYLVKAHEAQESFDEAKQTTKAAAEALCNVWKGDAADAFAQEQAKLQSWCEQLIGIASEYSLTLEKAQQKYEEMESQIKSTM